MFFLIRSLIVFAVFLTSILGFSWATFSDIGEGSYRDSILYLANHNVVQGYPDGSFGPNRSITRAEMMKIVLEAVYDFSFSTWSTCFSDIASGDWHSPYVCYGKTHSIVRGYPDGSFKPNKTVSFAEGLKIALEAFAVWVHESNTETWYQPYLDFVHSNNIFSRYSVRPDALLTRGEMSFLVHQLMLERSGDRFFDNVRDSRSLGCGQVEPSVLPDSLLVWGIARHFITSVWSHYDKDIPIPLIIAFHGRTNPNTMIRTYYKVEQAAGGNAIVVYPSGLPEEWPQRNWSDPGNTSDSLRDYAFFDSLVDYFWEHYCIDTDRVFVVWHSLGAWFTNSLACARGDVIRAIGSVGGGTSLSECSGPTAAIIMHNPKDELTDFRSGLVARDQLLQQNSCDPSVTESFGPALWHCVRYTECQAWAPVVRCPHSDDYENGRYYTHTRPDFAGETIWNFFEAQP